MASEPAKETIIAVSSPHGAGSTTLLRLSGPAAVTTVAAACSRGGDAVSEAAGGTGTSAALCIDGVEVPAWIVVHRAPRSYTREDLVEVLVPGSPPLVDAVARSLAKHGGARCARPGELTLRAFLGGRMDLSQVEAVASLMGSLGEAEARASLRALRGVFQERIESVAAEVLETLALIEAALDFPDEDIPRCSPGAILPGVRSARERVASLRSESSLRIADEGTLRVVLAGFPNAGKSSLLNAILGRPAAIASAIPGTTRDPVRGSTVFDGRRIEWVDTAGALDGAFAAFGGEEESDRPIWDAVRRITLREIEGADRLVWVADASTAFEESLAEYRRLRSRGPVLVAQKVDLVPAERLQALERLPEAPIAVSALRGRGIDDLVRRVAAPLSVPAPRAHPAGSASPPRFLVTARQDLLLGDADASLLRAEAALVQGDGFEYVASDLRDAVGSLADITRTAPRPDVLDLIFGRFCIGK